MVGFIDFAEQILTCTEPEGEFCEDITFLFLYLLGVVLKPKTLCQDYSTVTLFAKFLGWSTLHPRITAM